MQPQDPQGHDQLDWSSTPSAPTVETQAYSGGYGQQTGYQPPIYPAHQTQRLDGGSHRGVPPRLVAGIAALSLVLGGGAGAGAGALMAHSQADSASSASSSSLPSPVYQSEKVISGDVSSLTVRVVQQVGPAVVSILNDQAPQQDFFGNVSQATSAGSGVIIDKNGYIVTNYHVVASAQSLKVTFANGTSTSATLVGQDPSNDIAVIKVTAGVPAVAAFGDSSALKTGETVLAIGNALGNLQNTVTEGIISGLGRTLPNGNDPSGTSSGTSLQNMIQTDAAINHGNSGGPLVDLAGHVIGINTAVVRSSGSSGLLQGSDQAQGLGFAIPSNTVKAIADRLIFHTPSPFLGVDYRQVSTQMSSAYNLPVGAWITTTVAGSPAARAGLKGQDIVTAVNGQAIDDQHDLKTVLDTFHVGDTVKLTVYRGGRILTLSATLSKRPTS